VLTRRRPLHLLAATAIAAVLVSGCSLQLLGAPTGHLTLTAHFDNVADLVPGHTVQVGNVVVGSVTAVTLDGYRAKVTMSIRDGHPIPQGTTATLRHTSLLGEPFVDLEFPDGFDPAHAQYLASGTELTDTAVEPDLEDLAGRAGRILDAVDARDLGAAITATDQALAGNGPELQHLVAQLDTLVTSVDAQAGPIASTIDALGRLGAGLAPFDAQIGTLVDNVSATTSLLASDSDRLVAALRSFDDLARTTTNVILAPHAQQFTDLIREADAVLGSLAQHTDLLASMTNNFDQFVVRIPHDVRNGQLLVFVWADPSMTIAGVPVDQALPASVTSLVGP